MPRKFVFFVLPLLVVVTLAAWIYLQKERSDTNIAASSTSKSTPARVNKLSAEVYQVTPRPLQNTIQTTGTLSSSEFVSIRSEISGRVISHHFTEGQDVAKGDLLYRLDDSELQAQRQRTQHRRELAEARVLRIGKLLKQGGSSQEDFDNAQTEVSVIDAELKLLDAQLAKTSIKAPFDGRIGLRYVSPGSIINSSTELTTLQKLDPIRVEFSVPERVAYSLRNGMKIRFKLIGETNSHEGVIYAINPHIDSSTRNLQVRAEASNHNKQLVPGSFANIEITLDEIPDALLVPAIALIPGLNEQRVYVVKDGVVTARTVQVGQRLATEVQLISGLEPGDLVMTSGLLQAKPGMSVDILNAPANSQ
jgi:membrane fusion protein (multidrug efflux system)